jgi:hypothetical protein
MLHLPLGDHMHQLDATQENARAVKGAKPEHRSSDTVDCPMALLDELEVQGQAAPAVWNAVLAA